MAIFILNKNKLKSWNQKLKSALNATDYTKKNRNAQSAI